MKQAVVDYNREYHELIGGVAHSVKEIQDPVALGAMLYQLAQERKNTNLIIQQLNTKIDSLMGKISDLETRNFEDSHTASLSDRDMDVLSFVEDRVRVSAEDLRKKFKYRGKNAASARLSKLFHEGRLTKEYIGRKVIYKIKK
jgi:RNA recognition motif-containing protein